MSTRKHERRRGDQAEFADEFPSREFLEFCPIVASLFGNPIVPASSFRGTIRAGEQSEPLPGRRAVYAARATLAQPLERSFK